MTNILQTVKNWIDGKTPKSKTEQEIIKSENEQVKLTPFEEKLNITYMGCYNVNPVNPIITQELGTVHNQLDCINLGKSAEYQYVALQGGNLCLGTNNIGDIQSNAVSRNNCNMVCDETSAGYCGGVFKNQVYATSLAGATNNDYQQQLTNSDAPTIPTTGYTSSQTPSSTNAPSSNSTSPSNTTTSSNSGKESFKHLENFASHNKEMKMIDNNISQIDMLCQEPINKYNLLLSLLIVLLLAYIMIEIIYNK